MLVHNSVGINRGSAVDRKQETPGEFPPESVTWQTQVRPTATRTERVSRRECRILAPTPIDRQPQTALVVLYRAKRTMGAEHFFDEGRGNRLPGVRGTLWAAFNGVTELLDHRKTRQNPQQRLSSIWFGDNYRIKARAFALAQEKVEAWQN